MFGGLFFLFISVIFKGGTFNIWDFSNFCQGWILFILICHPVEGDRPIASLSQNDLEEESHDFVFRK